MDQNASAPSASTILFDGVCNFCNASVNFVLERDAVGTFRFASLQSAAGQRLLGEHGLPTGEPSTMVLVENGRVYLRSTAALRVASQLGGLWRAASLLLMVPAPWRDAVYEVVVRNRYRLMGRSETCRIPEPGWRARFLDA